MFRFTLPLALWGLLAVPALLLIYRLLGRARPLVVSTLFLWESEKPVVVGGRRLEKLQTPLLLFLELMAVFLMVTAATGPQYRGHADRLPVIVILDDSFSMGAGEPSARDQALEAMAATLDPDHYGPIRFIRAGIRAEPLEPGDGSWQDRLLGWTCGQEGANLKAALNLAQQMGDPETLVWVISDGEPDFPVEPGALRWQAFGRAHHNLALVNAARSLGPDGDRCLVEVANYAPITHITQLRLGTSPPLELSLAPGEIRKLVLAVPDELEELTLSLPGDVLPADDSAILLRRRPPLVRTALRLQDGPLKKALVRALETSDAVLLSDQRPRLIFTDQTSSNRPDTGHPPENEAETWVCRFVTSEASKAFIGPFFIDANHPLTEGVALDGVIWPASPTLSLEDATPVILAGNLALLQIEGKPTAPQLVFNYQAEYGNLTRSPNWPILIWNLIRWCADAGPGLSQINPHMGEPTQLRLARPGEMTLTLPDGRRRTYPPGGKLLALPTNQAGRYRVQSEDRTDTYAVNAFSREESDLSTRSSGSWGDWQGRAREREAWISLVPLLLVGALLALVLHWFLMGRFLGSRP